MADAFAPREAVRVPSVAEIQRAVAEHFGMRLAEMTSHRRARAVARPRQVAMYLARELTPLSLPQIGRHFGGRDHTTVMHAVAVIAKVAAVDPRIAEAIAEVAGIWLDDPGQLALQLLAAE